MRQVGGVMADKLNMSRGPAAVAVPLRGFSDRNRPGDLFYDPEADGEFVLALRERLGPRVRLVEIDAHINDELFAIKSCDILIEIMETGAGSRRL
jgi:uncharacterized protein (UPF0261 family)